MDAVVVFFCVFCLSLCKLIFNTLSGPPALSYSVSSLCCAGDGWCWKSDILQTGRTQTWNGVFCSGEVCVRGHIRVRVRENASKSRLMCFCRSGVTLWASTALAKLGYGASGPTRQLLPHPTVVSLLTHTHFFFGHWVSGSSLVPLRGNLLLQNEFYNTVYRVSSSS